MRPRQNVFIHDDPFFVLHYVPPGKVEENDNIVQTLDNYDALNLKITYVDDNHIYEAPTTSTEKDASQQKGPDCWYAAAKTNLVRCGVFSNSINREREKQISDYDDKLNQIQDRETEEKNFIKIIYKKAESFNFSNKTYNLPQHQFDKRCVQLLFDNNISNEFDVHYYQLLKDYLSETNSQTLSEFITSRGYKNTYSHMRSFSQNINFDFLNVASALYLNVHPDKLLENEPLITKISFYKRAIMLHIWKTFGYKLSRWNDEDSSNQFLLKDEIRKGVALIEILPKAIEKNKNSELKFQDPTRNIFGYYVHQAKLAQNPIATINTHIVTLIGLNLLNGRAYYIDPNDPSPLNQPRTIYEIAFSDLYEAMIHPEGKHVLENGKRSRCIYRTISQDNDPLEQGVKRSRPPTPSTIITSSFALLAPEIPLTSFQQKNENVEYELNAQNQNRMCS